MFKKLKNKLNKIPKLVKIPKALALTINKNKNWVLPLSVGILVVMLPVLFFVSRSVKNVEAQWYDEDWKFRKLLIIDHTKVSGTGILRDFPVLVNITDTDLRDKAKTDGSDIVFTDKQGRLLNSDIEKYDEETGNLVIWITVPEVYPTENTPIYIYYGNNAALPNRTPSNTWVDAYAGVWHLRETAGVREDATSEHGTMAEINTVAMATGKIAGSAAFVRASEEYLYTEVGSVLYYDSSASTSVISGGTASISHTTTTEDDRIMVVGISLDPSGGSVSAVTYNGTSLTNYGGQTNSTARSETWYLLNPDSGNHKVTITFTGTPTFVAGSETYYGTATTGILGTYTSGTGSGANPNVAIPSTVGDIVVDTIARQARNISVGSNQTQLWNITNGTLRGAGSYEQSGGGNVAMGWSSSGSGAWASGGMSIKPKPASLKPYKIAGNLTLSGWIYPTVVTAGSTFGIVGKWDGILDSYYLAQYGDEIRMYIESSSNYATTNAVNLTAGSWYYVTGVYNAAAQTVTIYVNGTAYATTVTGTIPSSMTIDEGWVGIGAEDYSTGGSNYYDGSIDEVRIYSGVQSADWIATEYNNQNSPSTFFSITGSEEKGPGPVMFVKFEEGQGSFANDSTSNGNTGTLTGTLWKQPDVCLIGKCVWFDGTDDVVTVGNKNSIDLDEELANGFTIQSWVKFNSAGELNVGQIFNKGTTTYIRAADPGSDGYLDLQASLDLATTDATLTLADAIKVNTWYHIAMAYTNDSDDEISIYINGNLAGQSTNGSGSPANESSNLLIGGPTAANFRGLIDEFKIYNYERTLANVISDCGCGQGEAGTSASFGGSNNSLSDGLVGYWKMDESSGNAADASGNDITLTNVGSATRLAGKFYRGSNFDDSDDYYYATSDTDLLTLQADGQYTWSFWVRPDDFEEWNALWQTYMSGGAYEFNIYAHTTTDSDAGPVTAGISTSWISSGATLYTHSSDNALTVSAWNHVMVTYNGTLPQQSRLKIYVNNVDVTDTSDVVSSGNLSTINPEVGGAGFVYLGRTTRTSPEEYFDGMLDEVRLYNRAVSALEIQQLYTYAPGPVAWYQMDTGMGSYIVDSSGNGYNSAVFENTPAWTEGRFGSALDFENTEDDYVYIDDNNDFDMPTNNFTLCFWTNPETTGPQFAGALGHRYGSSPEQGYEFRWDASNRLEFKLDFGAGSQELVTSTLKTDVWYHLCGVVDRSGLMSLYQDGKFVDSVDISSESSSDISSTAVFRIGRYLGGTDYDFDGKIDDIRLYNYARTPGQIIQDMNAGHPAPGSPVGSATAYWKFDEGYGDTAHNAGNAGSAINGDLAGSGTSCPTTGACPTWSNAGKYDKALDFDGADDYVNAGSDSSIDNIFSGGGTFEAWVYPRTRGENSLGTIFDKSASGNNGGSWLNLIAQSGNRTGLIFYSSFYATNQQNYWVSQDYVINLNSWNHIVISYDNSSYLNDPSIYINSVLIPLNVSRGNGDPAQSDASNSLYIGNLQAGSRTFDGLIDEVKIYDFALLAEQVLVDYNQGKSATMGSLSTTSAGIPDNSADRSYCVPGDTATCGAPIGEWLLNENQGTGVGAAKDTSTSGFDFFMDATMTQASWIQGKVGSALTFDGSDDELTYEYTYTPPTSKTALSTSIWIKPGFLVSDPTTYGIVFFGGINAYFNAGQDDITCQVVTTSGATTLHTTGITWEQDTWHQYVCTWDGTTMKAYFDGYLENYTSRAGTVQSSPNSAYIGYLPGATNWLGGLDQVRLYDYSLSPAQIAWEYNQGKPIAHYKFDECAGTTAYNSVTGYTGGAAGSDGTISIGATGSYSSIGTCASGTAAESRNAGTSGKRNSSLGFDGTDDGVIISDNDRFTFSTSTADVPFSLGVWVYSMGTQQDDDILIAKSDATLGTEYKLMLDENNLPKVELNYGAGNLVEKSNYAIKQNEWHHIAMTYDGSGSHTGIKLYIDAHEVPTTDSDSGTYTYMPNTTTNVTIGFRQNNGSGINNLVTALLDEVKIWNYNLTETQLRSEYNMGALFFGPNEGNP